MKDSRHDTYEHKHTIRKVGWRVMRKLWRRLLTHDDSKLDPPEKEIYDRFPDRVPYGTKEYGERLLLMRVAIEAHYAKNDHHPEHHGAADPLSRMSLLSVLEMLMDWMASAMRDRRDVRESILYAQKKYEISDQLTSILLNTLDELEKEDHAPLG